MATNPRDETTTIRVRWGTHAKLVEQAMAEERTMLAVLDRAVAAYIEAAQREAAR